jgi:antitoxin (DNA-binding transcriptional repressor) of toxin-antitoxin stability system
MSKRVTVQELAAHLTEHLAEVERGETVTVIAEQREIASIQPHTVIRHDPAFPLRDFQPGARPHRLGFDAVQWLIDERERERSGKKYGL